MNIKNYISEINAVESIFNNDGNFTKIEFDSRNVKENDMFVAIVGSLQDGHE